MPNPEPDFATPRRPVTDGERRALASVLRMRILRMCLYEELTNKQIAERLGKNPATVLHHVRTLVDQGFLTSGETRRGVRGSREVPYRATGKSWTLDDDQAPHELTLVQTFLDEVNRVPASQVRTTRLGLQLAPAELTAMLDELHEVLKRYVGKGLDPDGERISVFLAWHPEAN